MHAGGLLGCNPKSWRPGCHPCGTAGPGCSKESAARRWPHLLPGPLAARHGTAAGAGINVAWLLFHTCHLRQRRSGAATGRCRIELPRRHQYAAKCSTCADMRSAATGSRFMAATELCGHCKQTSSHSAGRPRLQHHVGAAAGRVHARGGGLPAGRRAVEQSQHIADCGARTSSGRTVRWLPLLGECGNKSEAAATAWWLKIRVHGWQGRLRPSAHRSLWCARSAP